MKQSISSLAKFAKEVNKKKFIKLSSKKQHELLAALAREYTDKNSFKDFSKRYEELQSWVELDSFRPASWLSEKEILAAYFRFHSSFSPNPFNLIHKKNTDNEKLAWTPRFDVSIYADNIRSPYNIGSILRIADNFGLKEVVHSSPDMNIFHPRIKKASREAFKWIPLRYENDPVSWLENSGLTIAAIETGKGAIDISQWKPPFSCIIVVGNEENGICEKIMSCCTEKIRIPMYGYKKSMNVNNALSIACNKYAEVQNKS